MFARLFWWDRVERKAVKVEKGKVEKRGLYPGLGFSHSQPLVCIGPFVHLTFKTEREGGWGEREGRRRCGIAI